MEENMNTLEKHKIYEIEVTGLGESGEGIGRIDGLTIFVHGGMPGDVVTCEITKLKKQYAIANVVEILKASPHRKEPQCQYGLKCGGCQAQHVKYESQLEIKTQLVQDAIERIGKVDYIKVEETIGMASPFNYRNKGQYPIRKIDGKVQIGFYKMRTHDLIDVETCELQHKINDSVVKIVKEFISEKKISVYDEVKKKGLLRHIVIRVAKDTNDTMVVLVARGEKIPYIEVLLESLAALEEVKSIVININKQPGNRILGSENITKYGDDKIIDSIGDLKFEISPLSFFQVNPIQTEVLYNKALEFADLQGTENVMDLYCGIGSISLFLAKKAKKVIGVELIEDAIHDANANAILNKIDNVEFYVGKAEEVVPSLYNRGMKADVVVVDPPRKGCDEHLIKTLIDIKPKKIVYVSCKASTMARDVKMLTEAGYRVEKIQPVDMFPWTMHVETIVRMQRKESAK